MMRNIMTNRISPLAAVKERIWFYEFELPDGTLTQTDLAPHVRLIHTSRREKLIKIIAERIPDATNLVAVDLGSSEGYYSIELARHFSHVHGLELRPESIAGARLISEALGIGNVTYSQADLQRMAYDPAFSADFVLMYGLLYHMENPIHVLRLASQLSRKHILIETQVFPYDVTGRIEDGSYQAQRIVYGIFSLSTDYSNHREGGSTDLALIPSLNALLCLLKVFGFRETHVLEAAPDDYEQFRRGSRVVVYGMK
jgi:tRNA (mo5U34)-methyltransferase